MADPAEYQAAFDQMAAKNALPAANVGQAARLAGACPSEAEIEEFKKQAGRNGCNFEAFKSFCDKTLHAEDDKKELAELFRSVDLADSGTVPLSAVKILQKFGEPLSDAEFASVLNEFTQQGSENFDYALMLQRIFQ